MRPGKKNRAQHPKPANRIGRIADTVGYRAIDNQCGGPAFSILPKECSLPDYLAVNQVI